MSKNPVGKVAKEEEDKMLGTFRPQMPIFGRNATTKKGKGVLAEGENDW